MMITPNGSNPPQAQGRRAKLEEKKGWRLTENTPIGLIFPHAKGSKRLMEKGAAMARNKTGRRPPIASEVGDLCRICK
jgi:hypothetical protein